MKCAVALAVLLLVGGCCSDPPPRLDAKKRAAFLDEIATVVSFGYLYGLPFDTGQKVNADAAYMTSDPK